MPQVVEAKTGEGTGALMSNMCDDLFRKWLVDLTREEKEIWLWNASIEMCKIKQRREI